MAAASITGATLGCADVIYDCGEDFLFDIALELCNFAGQVVCVEDGGAPAESPTRPPPAPLVWVETPAARRTDAPSDPSVGGNSDGGIS